MGLLRVVGLDMQKAIVLCTCALFFAPSACGGSGGVGDGGVASAGSDRVSIGLPPGKPLSSLTAAEALSACERLRASTQNALSEADIARFRCSFTATVFAIVFNADGTEMIDRARCEEAFSSCIADMDADAQASSDGMCDASFMTQFMSCDATAGELEACLNASLEVLRAQISMISCSSSILLIRDAGSALPEPAACAALEMKCPGALDGLDQEMGMGGDGDGDGVPPGPGGCTDTCSDAMDGFCDDGGDGFDPWCDYGTDCTDCGARPMR